MANLMSEWRIWDKNDKNDIESSNNPIIESIFPRVTKELATNEDDKKNKEKEIYRCH